MAKEKILVKDARQASIDQMRFAHDNSYAICHGGFHGKNKKAQHKADRRANRKVCRDWA
ncbi:hypothetical protein [Eubacterium oxidoreducens]|uniref:Uncharacterized protein n=1 Tax=Eubacterium oxidoreducens TaxID=1732 RepID=A0A1G6B440_EUBOX|nr:hypothetical protein [Eubacterium oxidoreducens]SDB15421.1 hypothetical protein SAMN02910417_01149 [Eubacterium oxidoreducens]